MRTGPQLLHPCQRDHEPDRPMATHVQITGIIEEDDACCTGWIGRLTEKAADEDVGSSRLINDGRANLIEAIAKDQEPFRKRATAKIRAALDDDPSRLATGMGVDDTNCLHGGVYGEEKRGGERFGAQR